MEKYTILDYNYYMVLHNISNFFYRYNILCEINDLHVDNGAFCVVCDTMCVTTTILKPKLLEFRNFGCQFKRNCHLKLNVCAVPFLNNLVLFLALKMLE